MSHFLAFDIRNLSCHFQEKKVLDHFNLKIPSGELVCLRGTNGSGKTTLLRILSTLQRPNTGDALINGYSIIKDSKTVRREIAWVPATQGGFLPKVTGRDNLLFFASLQGISSSQVESEIKKWAKVLPLQNALSVPYQLCSAGMKQSLSLIRAILKSPKILILDEPTMHLDVNTVESVASLLLESLPSRTILFSSHGKDALTEKAHRVFHLEAGQVL